MNIITIANPKKTKVIKRIGTIKEAMSYIGGYLQALNDRGINTDNVKVDHEYIQQNGVKVNRSHWIDTDTKEIN